MKIMNKIQPLKAKIAQLQKENNQLRVGFYEIINLAYSAVNKTSKSKKSSKKETSSAWDPEKLFKILNSLNSKQANECFFSQIKDIFTNLPKGEKSC